VYPSAPSTAYVGGVAVQAPDNDSGQPGGVRLVDHEVADAAFIESPAVVDYQHVAGCRLFERLQEDVDAAHMARR
jgi:hypothetical protein